MSRGGFGKRFARDACWWPESKHGGTFDGGEHDLFGPLVTPEEEASLKHQVTDSEGKNIETVFHRAFDSSLLELQPVGRLAKVMARICRRIHRRIGL